MAVSPIKMPQLGESVTEGTVDKWLKHEGDFVKRDEPLVEVVTDKVNAEIPSPFEGKLVKIAVSEGETVRVGAVIAQIETAGALAELSEIAALLGLDVLYVGPNDLTQALGVPGRYGDARYQDSLRKIAAQAKFSGKAAGIMLGRADQIPGLRDLGYSFFTTSDRTLVLESARAWRAAPGRQT